MNNQINAFLGLVSILALSQCSTKDNCINASDRQSSQIRKLNEFTSVETGESIKVVLKQGNSHAVTLNAANNIIPYIKTSVENNKLSIKLDKNICREGEIMVVVSSKNYEEIFASGTVEVGTEGKLSLNNLNLNLSGANKVYLNMDVNHLETKADGDSNIILKGNIKSHSVKATGECTINNQAI
jgi:hypothetical protein